MSPALSLRTATAACERRRHQRYRINTTAQVFLSGVHERVETLDISSGGVLLKSGALLPVGRRVQLFVDWPALLNERCALRLIIEGKIIRSNPEGTAIKIIRYDYRTRYRAPVPVAASA